MPNIFRLKLWFSHVTSKYIKLQIYSSALSHQVFSKQEAPYLGMGQTF